MPVDRPVAAPTPIMAPSTQGHGPNRADNDADDQSDENLGQEGFAPSALFREKRTADAGQDDEIEDRSQGREPGPPRLGEGVEESDPRLLEQNGQDGR